jgi:hypothetical protein
MNYKEKRDDLFDDKSPVDSSRNTAMKKGYAKKKSEVKKMGEYKKDMMHERELIYDAKKQIHSADKKYKAGDKGKKQEMIHDREMIHDAKKQIHHEDQRMHVVNRIAGKNNRR